MTQELFSRIRKAHQNHVPVRFAPSVESSVHQLRGGQSCLHAREPRLEDPGHVVGQGLATRDKFACKAPENVRRAAAAQLVAA